MDSEEKRGYVENLPWFAVHARFSGGWVRIVGFWRIDVLFHAALSRLRLWWMVKRGY